MKMSPSPNNKAKKKKQKTESQKKVKPVLAVMFILKTPRGSLVKELRDAENKISEITEDKIKIVERSGVKLRSLLHKANPWGNVKCDKRECLVCSNPYNESFNCDKRNVTYKTVCLKCKENFLKKEEAEEGSADDTEAAKEPLKTYYGETHCSAYERGTQHGRDYISKKEDSHMFKHFSDKHSNEKIEDVRFGMSVIKQHFSSFSRQVMESVLIFSDPHVMNSKSMYNRCQVPRLSVMVGDQVASDQDSVKYDQVELDTELADMRNKHQLASTEEIRPIKRQKRWHVNKERYKKKKGGTEDAAEVSPSLEPIVVSPTLPGSSSQNVASPVVVTETRDSNAKLFPIFSSKDKSNSKSKLSSNEKDETSNNKVEENPSLETSVGATAKKKKLKAKGGNNSIIKFLTPLRGKAPTKPNSSSDPP